MNFWAAPTEAILVNGSAPQAFGCNTYSYIRSCNAADCVARLADLGFREFEVMVSPGHLWGPDRAGIAELQRVVQTRDLRITTLNMPNIDINIAAAAEGMRAYSISMIESVIQIAGEVGAAGIVVGPGKANPLLPPDAPELAGYAFSAFDRLCGAANAAGTELWLENMPFAFPPDSERLMGLIEAHGSSNLGIVYDVTNAHFLGEDIGSGLLRCQERLRLVHVSDTGTRVYKHDPIGRGTVPFHGLAKQLRRVNYRHAIMLEVISPDPDRDILETAERLLSLGLGPKASMRGGMHER